MLLAGDINSCSVKGQYGLSEKLCRDAPSASVIPNQHLQMFCQSVFATNAGLVLRSLQAAFLHEKYQMSQLGNNIPSFDGLSWGKTPSLCSPPSPALTVLVGY